MMKFVQRPELAKCHYCGKSKVPFVRLKVIRRANLSIGTKINDLCCSVCFCKMKSGKLMPSTNPTEQQVRALIRHIIFRATHPSTTYESLIWLTREIEDLERYRFSLASEFQEAANKASELGVRLAQMDSEINNSKTQVSGRLGRTYEVLREIADDQISDKALRRSVFERDGFQCKMCGTKEKLTIDHVRPVSKGGGNEFENLQTLCLSCNCSKGDDWSKNPV